MELISSYLSKPIISIYEASMVGTVISATFDKKMRRVCSLLVISDIDEEEIIYTIPINRIMTADNALTIKNRNCVRRYVESSIFVKSPINHPVYSTTGEKKGIIRDVTFDENNYQVLDLLLEESTISANDVASISNSLVIIKGDGFTRLQPPRAPRIRKSPKPYQEEIVEQELHQMNMEIDDDNDDEIDNIEPEPFKPQTLKVEERVNTPARIISDYSFLLNRKVLADVYSTTGELIIPAGASISIHTVEIARRHGKLVELTVGSRL